MKFRGEVGRAHRKQLIRFWLGFGGDPDSFVDFGSISVIVYR